MSDASLPRVEDHHPPFGTPSPNASAQETAVEESQAAVRKLVEEHTRLSEQLLSVQKYKKQKVTVEELEKLDIYDVTDTATADTKIAKLEEKEKTGS
ncbi:hypothetical protein DIPPA_29178 [Diplonema papillatum]|nr:hypothetical protein DIPPA_29178 [Diplonema papillatum]